MKEDKVDFVRVLDEKKKLVWPEVKTSLDRLIDFPAYCRVDRRFSGLADFHLKLAADYPCRQGKYFRPTLMLLTAEAMGFDRQEVLKTAAAMQISEEWILIHDDLEDQSAKRRGRPTLHCLYGLALAVNAGDALHVLTWEVLNDNFALLGPKKALAVTEEFGRMLRRTTLGQTAELKWMQENRFDLTEEDVLFILESKTAYYTCAGPMRLGAILAGASPAQLKAIYRFGRILGRCFQVRDDLLDLTSDFKGLKKQKADDLREGKRTVILIHLWQKIKGRDKNKLKAIMTKGREEKTDPEIDWVLAQMEKYGSLEYAEKLVRDWQEQAHRLFDKELEFLTISPARQQLEAAIDFVAERKH